LKSSMNQKENEKKHFPTRLGAYPGICVFLSLW